MLPEMRSLVPQSGSMVLLDRVLSADAERLCAEVVIRRDSLFCNAAGVGAWVGLEYMAQAIGAHAGYLASLAGEPVKLGFLLGTRRYECHCELFAPGAVLQVHVERQLLAQNGLGAYSCRIESHNKELAAATVTVFQPADAQAILSGAVNE